MKLTRFVLQAAAAIMLFGGFASQFIQAGDTERAGDATCAGQGCNGGSWVCYYPPAGGTCMMHQ